MRALLLKPGENIVKKSYAHSFSSEIYQWCAQTATRTRNDLDARKSDLDAREAKLKKLEKLAGLSH